MNNNTYTEKHILNFMIQVEESLNTMKLKKVNPSGNLVEEYIRMMEELNYLNKSGAEECDR